MTDLVIRDGWVVTPDSEGVMDIGVTGEQISFVAAPGQIPTDPTIPEVSAANRVVTPGGGRESCPYP